MAQIQLRPLLKKALAVLRFVWDAISKIGVGYIVVGTIILTVFVTRTIVKPKPSVRTVTVSQIVRDTVTIHDMITRVLHDTVTPEPNIITRFVKEVVPPDTVIQYVPISAQDSASIARLFLMTGLTYDHGDLSIGYVNMASRVYNQSHWTLGNDNFEVGTNAEGVWVLEHKQFVRWDGLNIGAGYYGISGYLMASTGLTFFRRVDLSARVITLQQPWAVELTYHF